MPMIQSDDWNNLMDQAGTTVAHWMGQAEKFGVKGSENQLKFAEIAMGELRTTAILKSTDEVCKYLSDYIGHISAVDPD